MNALAALHPAPGAPASAWVARIAACWRASFEGILEVGRLLTAAKVALPHGEFGSMIESELPFSASTAQRLMAVAADPRITNPAHVQHLPPHWGTLYELTKLNDEQFQTQIEAGTIRPDMERQEAIKAARSIMASRQEPDDSLDFFPTPPWATRALCQHVLPAAGMAGKRLGKVWEPACGEGHMAEVLAEYADQMFASDVHAYGYEHVHEAWEQSDFLADEGADPWADWIITNPPFGDKTEAFVLRALDLAKVGVAMFVRLQWLETIGRYERLFRDKPPTLIAFFCERVNLCKGRWDPEGSTATAYIWLVWIKGRALRAPFWIPPGCREALTHDDDAERFTTHPVTRKPEMPAAGPVDVPSATVGVDAGPPASSPQPAPTSRIDDLPERVPDFLRRRVAVEAVECPTNSPPVSPTSRRRIRDIAGAPIKPIGTPANLPRIFCAAASRCIRRSRTRTESQSTDRSTASTIRSGFRSTKP